MIVLLIGGCMEQENTECHRTCTDRVNLRIKLKNKENPYGRKTASALWAPQKTICSTTNKTEKRIL